MKKPGTLGKLRRSDPQLAEEARKYERPLPSRAFILQLLAEQGVPASFERVAGLLEIEPFEFEAFRRRLGAMLRDGQLLQNRREDFIIPDKADLVRGRVQGHPDGYGFLVPDAGGTDYFLGPHEMQKVLHGDRVLARCAGVDRRGRPEARIVEVLERVNARLVGRVIEERGVLIVAPEDRRISQDILIAPGARRKPRAGQVVMVEIVEQPTRIAQPIGRIVETLGDYLDPGMEIEIALRKFDLPFEFSPAALRQAGALPDAVRPSDLRGREDLRAAALVTIDGEDARDFDDALWCEREGRGFRLVVAIADVSHYVRAGGALDGEARARGNSVYFPRRVIPMLPEKLSNGLCSLNPQVDRLAMVCDMAIGAAGAIQSYRFYPAVIRSLARLTYTEVAAALYGKDAGARRRLAPLAGPLAELDRVYRALAQARARRGAIDFETVETVMEFDPQGKIARILPHERNDAHRIVEECMLAANVCASELLTRHRHPALYRIHEGPTAEKLASLREFLKEFGLDLSGGDEPHASDYARLLEKLAGRPDKQLLQTVMLRSLRQAVYSPENVGHFGLAYESYTHFTSPIRRYPDLLIHRAIKAVLGGGREDPGHWEEIGQHCSMTERRADEATREVESWLKCYFMQDRIGEVFTGSVSGVAPFGIFVALDGIYVEGLVHISDLGADYFHYDEARRQLAGERTGARFRLADRVRVQLVRADLETKRIDFRLAGDEGGRGPARERRRASRR
ncbi:MAG: ribonuclease R [Betaproteobacteria bacterium CG2_30_68_42]|nr:MAG: ribonuclease R [Betaproteobacteria bacterium CG2_30_68_42]PJA57096.1 MAG: ribonuclease R [Rhodocyclales bacterium CG_4_9_14_3_um_filter_68_10]